MADSNDALNPGDTTEWLSDRSPGPQEEAADAPEAVGRYRVVRLLGKGGFGRVYLAQDGELHRLVAVKIPNRERVDRPGALEAFLSEARILASLDHPGIVPVFDVGREADGSYFVVSKYIEGRDLAHRMREGRPALLESVRIVAAVADAIHHAHTRGLVHRDIKPSNIILDVTEKPWVADFGLALKEVDLGKGYRHAGTPAYMSPEQARGEGHLVDGRSDIFSLGVVLYELLTGRRPFVADSLQGLLALIISTETRPPRQIDDRIPKELERICLKALAQRATERYTTARDLAEDLGYFIEQAAASEPTALPGPVLLGGTDPDTASLPSTLKQSDSSQHSSEIVPKGLRSFDEHDADFFLELLPGPRDREGLPESLRFWKTRIEETEADRSFRVGLLYGPSGCGKSSLVKAGLLPRLGGRILTLYVEASADETEVRLARAIRKRCPDLPPGAGIVEALTALRRGFVLRTDRKVLLVLDQFEQWLQATSEQESSELVQALRQCDGERVQALVLVRDDFWLGASRFMKHLEVRLLEGENSALVDLFDGRHARKVLTLFGRAYGALPDSRGDLDRDQDAFVDQAVAGLAQDGKVVPVRLALFAEMVKSKPWTAATLRALGGTEGVGVSFLEETFSASTAPAEHRRHQRAAQAVLQAFLPATGADLKGEMRGRSELLEASGYSRKPEEFDNLIRILDTELRLITPISAEVLEGAESPPGAGGERYYQLTHDYLVPTLRKWLTGKQRETREGRARLLLAERAALWNVKPENRHLPSLSEWVHIRLATSRANWTEPQLRMMAAARRHYAARTAWSGLLVLFMAALIGSSLFSLERWRRQNEVHSLVSQLLVAEWARLPSIFSRLNRERESWWDEVERIAQDKSRPPQERLRARLALARYRQSTAIALVDELGTASPQQLRIMWDQLEPWKASLSARLWGMLEDPQTDPSARCRYACLLAATDPANRRWRNLAGDVVNALVEEEDPLVLPSWVEQLAPVRGSLIEPLASACLDRSRTEVQRLVATSALAELGGDMPERLTRLMLDVDARQHAILLRPVAHAGSWAGSWFQSVLQGGPQAPAAAETSGQKLNAAMALAHLGQWGAVWPLLDASADPGLRSLWIHRAAAYGLAPAALATGLQERLGPGVRQAILLALGGYPPERLRPGDRVATAALCRRLFELDADPGVHAAAEWLLRKWGRAAELKSLQKKLVEHPNAGRWYVNRQGETMVLVPGPATFVMGSPDAEPDRDIVEVQHHRRINHSFAIAAHEVTVAQFLQFHPDFDYARGISPSDDCPINRVSWFEAAAYCRWLTEQEGFPESEQCYPEEIGPAMKLPADFLTRTGYRLPTEAEWECACRAGTSASRFFGDDGARLGDYAWFNRNADDRLWPVGLLRPNPWGLFDVYGNSLEWCENAFKQVELARSTALVVDDQLPVNSTGDRALRGGGYRYSLRDTRSAKRFGLEPESIMSFIGFRVARTVRDESFGPRSARAAGSSSQAAIPEKTAR